MQNWARNCCGLWRCLGAIYGSPGLGEKRCYINQYGYTCGGGELGGWGLVYKLLKNGNSDRIERHGAECSDEMGRRQMCKKQSGWVGGRERKAKEQKISGVEIISRLLAHKHRSVCYE
jgi:hypothetical protein